jgi:hypothetical protein
VVFCFYNRGGAGAINRDFRKKSPNRPYEKCRYSAGLESELGKRPWEGAAARDFPPPIAFKFLLEFRLRSARDNLLAGRPRSARGLRDIVTQNYVRPEIALEPHVSFRAIATFSPRPPYFFFLPPFLAVFLAAVFFFAALRLAAIMLHLL